jgi:hypothetical protein
MKHNQLYLYLSYILKTGQNSFPIDRRVSSSGSAYLYIPLLEAQDSFQHSEYGLVRIKKPHLTCFEQLTEESYSSDIEFTCHLEVCSDIVKVHIYLNETGRDIGIYSKNMTSPEKETIFSFDDLKIINHLASGLSHQIRDYCAQTKSQYLRFYSEYPKVLERESLLEIQLSSEDTERLELEVIQKIRERLYILDKVLQQSVNRLIIAKEEVPRIDKDFQTQAKYSIRLFELIKKYLSSLDAEIMHPQAKRRYEYCQLKTEITFNLLKEICGAYFRAMVLAHQYQDMSIIEPYLSRPSEMVLRNIIRNQPQEILVILIKKFNISLTENILDIEPSSIIEFVIRENKWNTFEELIREFLIDFRYKLADQRPLPLVFEILNNSIVQKLIDNYYQSILSKDNPESLLQKVKEHIQSRDVMIEEFKSFGSIRASFKRQAQNGLKSVSPSDIYIDYEFFVANLRIEKINALLKDYRKLSLTQNIELVKEKHILMLLVKTCAARESEHIKFKIIEKKSILSSITEEKPISYYASLPGIPSPILDCIRMIKENIIAYFSFLPGNSYHILVKAYLLHLVKQFTEIREVHAEETVKEIFSFIRDIDKRAGLSMF